MKTHRLVGCVKPGAWSAYEVRTPQRHRRHRKPCEHHCPAPTHRSTTHSRCVGAGHSDLPRPRHPTLVMDTDPSSNLTARLDAPYSASLRLRSDVPSGLRRRLRTQCRSASSSSSDGPPPGTSACTCACASSFCFHVCNTMLRERRFGESIRQNVGV